MRLLLTIILLLSLTACVTVQTPPPAKTVIHDQAEAELLLGKHLFTEWYITRGSYIYFGESNVIDKNGLYHIEGIHENYWHASDYHPMAKGETGGYIKIKGDITEINTMTFNFSGEIEYLEIRGKFAIESDILCRTKGEFTFSRKKHPKYWRTLKQKEICNIDDLLGGSTLDIFTSPLKGEPPHGNTQRLFLNDNAHLPPEYHFKDLTADANSEN